MAPDTPSVPSQRGAPRGRIVVFGIMFWYPLAGVSYQFLHYLIGLRKLGYDVWYVEDSYWDVYDPVLCTYTPDATRVLDMIRPVLERFGFGDRWAFRDANGVVHGMGEAALADLYRTADGCLNVTGGHELRDEHMAMRKRVYVESDPFASQVRVAQGDPRTLRFIDAYNEHFSFGENLGAADCAVPSLRYAWKPTRQPVDMELWATSVPGGSTWNTITTWRNKTAGLEWNGDLWYWTKDREFRKIIDLPKLRPGPFELACSVEDDVHELLVGHGWHHRESVSLSSDIDSYRAYIQGSRGEFTVARDQYARARTGWFSDRTVCYLAAGRPVITQETGFSRYVATGAGLFGWNTMDDILAAIDRVESDYAGACRAARDVANEYFSTTRVLESLMTRAGL